VLQPSQLRPQSWSRTLPNSLRHPHEFATLGSLNFMPTVGDWVRSTTKRWITQPTRCPNGHPLGPNQVLVGQQACLGHGGGHTTWTCRTCDQTVYGPPNTHCTALEGPAQVRLSNGVRTDP